MGINFFKKLDKEANPITIKGEDWKMKGNPGKKYKFPLPHPPIKNF